MRRKILHPLLIVLLAALQAAHGAYSGATLCREASGDVTLEWAQEGPCEPAGEVSTPCVTRSEDARAEHCLGCVDIPLPSETSAKSLSLSAGVAWIPSATFVESLVPEPVGSRAAPLAAPRRPAFEPLSSIRLLL